MNQSIIIGAIIISAAILVNGFLERRGHVVSTGSALSAPAASSNQTISVLRFENLSQDKANASFADGLQRAIITRLTEQHVKAASVEEAPHTGELLLGSVEKAGDRVRINVQLVDATSRLPRWAETYDRELTDVFALQSEVAEKVAKAVAARKT